MAMIKPSKPEAFEGRRDALHVNTWLYQVEMYLNVCQMNNPQQLIAENMKVSVASTLLKGTAANWWFILVQSGQAPGQWDEFVNCVRTEFIPQDSIRRARDRLRGLVQRTSVSAYLNQFRNIVIAIPGMNEGEKLDRFCTGLKPQVRLEVMKGNPENLADASKIALNVDNALMGAGMFNPGGYSGFNMNHGSSSGSSSAPQPMDIGNVEGNMHYRGKSFKPKKKGQKTNDTQRQSDLQNNACFVCHKPGCRPWKHNDDERQTNDANNVQAGEKSDSSDSESEN